MILEADLHVHTVASGHAYSTVIEIAREARKKGLKMVAITDHGPAMTGAPTPIYFNNLWVVHPQVEGLEILRGVEANILEGGALDLEERYLRRLDLVLAGFHSECLEPGSVEENTRNMIKALENPYVDMICHPGNPSFQIDPERVVKAAKRLGKILEINNNSYRVRMGSYENCLEIARLVAREGVMIAINSDSHFAYDVGESDWALSIIKDAGVPEELVLTAKAERVKEYLKQRGKRLGEHTTAVV